MFERFSRSWALVKASYGVLRQDRELLVFPLLSGLATLVIALSFLLPLFFSGAFEAFDRNGEPPALMLVLGFLFYLSQYFVIFFFNSALVGAAMIRLNGGDPTVADGLRIARSKIGPILGYAAIAATVGLVLKIIEDKAGWLGKWIAGLLGVAFTVATFLAVPVLVSRDVGPMQAVKESAGLLKKTWGENLIGNGGLGLVFGLIYVALVFVFIALILTIGAAAPALAAVLVGLFVLAALMLALIHAALQGIYSAALYQYAMGEGSHTGIAPELLNGAFKLKA